MLPASSRSNMNEARSSLWETTEGDGCPVKIAGYENHISSSPPIRSGDPSEEMSAKER